MTEMKSTEWIKIVSLKKIPDGLSVWVKKRKRFIIISYDGEIKSVFEDLCPHNRRIKMSADYDITQNTITCNFHGACYDYANGEQLEGPGIKNLVIWPHRIEGKNLELKFVSN